MHEQYSKSCRLHTLPPPTRSDKEPYIHGMDCWTSLRADNATDRGRDCGSLEIKVGEAEAVHDWRVFDGWHMSTDIGLGVGDCEHFCEGYRYGMAYEYGPCIKECSF